MLPGPKVLKLELILKLKIKRNDWLLAVCKQLIIALYFEFETVLKFVILEPRAGIHKMLVRIANRILIWICTVCLVLFGRQLVFEMLEVSK